MTASARTGESLRELAMGKLTRVLGAEQAERVFDEALRAAGLEELRSADDLHAFAQALVARGGMEAAIGGLLSVAAVVRGAGAR